MAARFARQKDHATLLRALVVLRQRGLTPTLTLAGGGKARAQQAAQRLSAELGLQDQVQFIGMCNDVPGLLRAHRVCVLSTHYEGDRKSTRLNSSHLVISYAVFCLKKKKQC